MNRETKEFSFKMTDINDAGTFSGYASVWDQVDAYSDAVEKGAFKKTLSENKTFPMLWSHETREPIGIISGRENPSFPRASLISCDIEINR